VALFLVLLAAVPFVLPIVAFLSLAGVRRRLAVVEELLEQQQRALDDMTKHLRQTQLLSCRHGSQPRHGR
jgi:hypothetical protein